MGKIGRNDPCPCGSGRKYKKCCLEAQPARAATASPAAGQKAAQARLRALLAEPRFRAVNAALRVTFFGPPGVFVGPDGTTSDYLLADDAFKSWVLFDVPRDDGSVRVDELLGGQRSLSAAERQYLSMMRESAMRLYEVVDVVPGFTITFRDVLDGRVVVAYDIVYSVQVRFGELIAARIVPRGASGRPEIDGGFLPQSGTSRDRQRAELVQHLAELRRERPHASDLELTTALPPYFHHRWTKWREEQFGPAMVLASAGPPDEAVVRREAERDAEERRLEQKYTRWLDEPQPALGDLTPTQAAQDPQLRGRLVEALQELEDQYKVALRRQEPSYDPSWLWQALRLHDEEGAPQSPRHPPPMAHEWFKAGIPGLTDVVDDFTERLRSNEGDRVLRTVPREELIADAAVRHFAFECGLQEALACGSDLPAEEAERLVLPLELCCNFELHRRKVFWVDERLSWTLSVCDPTVAGDLLRLPFPSFAVAFTDRYALGLVERLVSRMARDPQDRGLFRVLTAYVIELPQVLGRRCIRLLLAGDSLDLHQPFVIERDVWIEAGASLDAIVHDPGPGVTKDDDPLYACTPVDRLIRLVINAILHATSANAVSEHRPPPEELPAVRRRGRKHFSSEAVHYLPGTIDIPLVRRIQRAVRGGGGELMHQCLVRGHFRRPGPDWSDQRLRFIEPYWRGPDDAGIVERQYRLTK